MNDGIISGSGNSRLARSVSDFKEKYPTYDDFASALVAGTLPLDILFNAEGWSQQPDFLNKANLLSDFTAGLFAGLPDNPMPNDVFGILSKAAIYEDGAISNASGTVSKGVGNTILYPSSYVGTGTNGNSNRNSITFDKPPKLMLVWRKKQKDPNFSQMGIFGIDAKTAIIISYLSDEGSIDGYISMQVSGNTVEWWSTDSISQLNVWNDTYYLLALLNADE